MSDPIDSLFDGLHGQAPPVPFAPAAAVRRRGRQRANRQAVSVGVAVLAVTGLGAGGLVTVAGQPDPTPPPAASPSRTDQPSPATPTAPPTASVPTARPPATPGPVPTARGATLLTAADLAGTGWQQTTNELLEGAWYWDGAQSWCPEYRLEDYPSVQQRQGLQTVSWIRPGEALPERVDQIVERFAPGAAAANVADVRAYAELCSRRPSDGDQVAPTFYETEATGFAGDESLLLRVEQYHFNDQEEIEPAGEFHRVAVVRVGDAVTTIVYQAGGEVREVAARAAERLR